MRAGEGQGHRAGAGGAAAALVAGRPLPARIARDLPGKPDIVLPGRRLADLRARLLLARPRLRPRRPRARRPTATTGSARSAATAPATSRARAALEAAGWRVETVWECELKDRRGAGGAGEGVARSRSLNRTACSDRRADAGDADHARRRAPPRRRPARPTTSIERGYHRFEAPVDPAAAAPAAGQDPRDPRLRRRPVPHRGRLRRRSAVHRRQSAARPQPAGGASRTTSPSSSAIRPSSPA